MSLYRDTGVVLRTYRLGEADRPGEDLAVGLHQRHQRRRHTDQARDQPGEALHARVRGSRQPGVPECSEPLGVTEPGRGPVRLDFAVLRHGISSRQVTPQTARRASKGCQ